MEYSLDIQINFYSIGFLDVYYYIMHAKSLKLFVNVCGFIIISSIFKVKLRIAI